MSVVMSANNLVAHCDEGVHDKVYIACVRRVGDDYIVLGKWGRRGSHLASQEKGIFNNFEVAIMKARDLFNKKLKKGYVNIEHPSYTGPVSFSGMERELEAEIGNHSPSLPKTVRKPTKKKTQREEYAVVCTLNSGVEDGFDADGEYLARETDEDGTIEVMDCFGKWRNVSSARFVNAEV